MAFGPFKKDLASPHGIHGKPAPVIKHAGKGAAPFKPAPMAAPGNFAKPAIGPAPAPAPMAPTAPPAPMGAAPPSPMGAPPLPGM